MDHYLNTEISSNRLIEEYDQYKSLVIAFDFDDTVYDFHKKGRLYNDVIQLLKDLKSINCYLICWTGQEDLEFVSEYLIKNEIPFDAINENPPFHKSNSRKIYANAYLDDRAGLKQVYTELRGLIDNVQGNENINILEKVSIIIHEQWVSWAKEILNSEPNLSKERIERWNKECFSDYENLSEEMENLDRKFANKILEII